MRKTKESYKFYLRFLSPYLLLLLLPISIIGYMNYISYIDILKDEINTNYEHNLEMIKSEVDTEIKNIRTTIYQMSSNENLTDNVDTYSNLARYKIISELNNYNNFNTFISELILYKRNSNVILSSDCEYTLSEFINTYYRYNHWTEKEFTQFVNNIKKDAIRSPEHVTSFDLTQKKFLTLAYPFPIFKKEFSSTLLVLIQEKDLHNIFEKHQYLDQESIIIIDKNQTLLSSYNQDLPSSELESLYNQVPIKPSFVFNIDHEEYLVNSIKSDTTGLTFISLCPTSVYMKKINQVQLRLVFTFILVLILGSIIILLFMRKNSTPIYNIYKLLNTSNKSSHYLKDIKNAIHTLSNENLSLKNLLAKQQPAIKNYSLVRLLSGDYKNIHEFNEGCKEHPIPFSSDKLGVIVFNFPTGIAAESDMKQKVKMIIEKHLQSDNTGYCLETCDNNTYTCIVSYSEDVNFYHRHLSTINNQINQKFTIDCTIGIGNFYSGLDQLGCSLIEAQAAAQYGFVKGSNSIINYSEINYDDVDLTWYPGKLFEDIRNAIHLKDIQKVNEYIDRVIVFIKNSDKPIFVIRCLCYELINIIIRQIYELNIYQSLNQHHALNIMSIMNCDSIDELAIGLKNICDSICQYMNQPTLVKKNNMKEKMLMYIQEKCFLCDFSIGEVADYFNLSQSSLSQQFKHYTGKTISHYVDNLRIEKAKLLLKTTKLPIKDIIVQVGYYDSSSFTRKFKQMVGMTPGKYRSLYKS